VRKKARRLFVSLALIFVPHRPEPG